MLDGIRLDIGIRARLGGTLRAFCGGFFLTGLGGLRLGPRLANVRVLCSGFGVGGGGGVRGCGAAGFCGFFCCPGIGLLAIRVNRS